MPDTTVAIAILLGSFVVLLAVRMPISFTLAIDTLFSTLSMMRRMYIA